MCLDVPGAPSIIEYCANEQTAGLSLDKYPVGSFREKPLSTQDHFLILIVVKGD